ncbi:MAG TPA: hypothetical protein VMW17_18510 [Candidatus Binatia bacterium]|nr:hypothetical protein [Candidatus Binatia bacterium]
MAERHNLKVSKQNGETDLTQYCPNCGVRGEWQKCKLVCTNPQCGVRTILACVD